jgi:hypothetical protein
LVTITKVDLGNPELLAREICFDWLDVGEAFQRYVLHGAHGARIELQDKLVRAACSRHPPGSDHNTSYRTDTSI